MGIDKIFPVEKFFAGARVSRKGHASPAVFAHVPKNHALHIDSGAPIIREAVQLSIGHSSGRIPAFEYCGNGSPELFHGVLGERLSRLIPHDLLVGGYESSPFLSGHIGIQLFPCSMLELFQFGFKKAGVDIQHNVAVHGDEPPITVPGEPRIPAGFLKPHYRLIVQSEIQYRVHHAWHGNTGTAPHGYQ